MSDDKKEPWLNYLALTTVIFAVCATLSTFKGGGYSTRSVLSQSQASDQWAYFQAKSIRENMYRIQKENLELQLNLLPPTATAETKEKYVQALKIADEKISKYSSEKEEIQKAAKALEEKRDDAQRHGPSFGFAVIFFQVAILLSTISGLFRKKAIWFFALPIGAIGIFYFVNGFILFLG